MNRWIEELLIGAIADSRGYKRTVIKKYAEIPLILQKHYGDIKVNSKVSEETEVAIGLPIEQTSC